MKPNLSLLKISGFFFVSFFGTLLHFIYDWTNKSIFVAPFSGVNESTWEHMKLLYFPLLIFSLFESRFFKKYKNFWCIKFISISLGLTSIPVLFYTYNGVIAKSPDWINISIFFISAAIAFLTEYYLFKRSFISPKCSKACFYVILFMGFLFFVFTFWTPKLNIFRDPITKTYGI